MSLDMRHVIPSSSFALQINLKNSVLSMIEVVIKMLRAPRAECRSRYVTLIKPCSIAVVVALFPGMQDAVVGLCLDVQILIFFLGLKGCC